MRRLLARVGSLSALLLAALVAAILAWQVAELMIALAGPDLNVGR